MAVGGRGEKTTKTNDRTRCGAGGVRGEGGREEGGEGDEERRVSVEIRMHEERVEHQSGGKGCSLENTPVQCAV